MNTENTGRCGGCQHWKRYTDPRVIHNQGPHAGSCSCDRFVYDDPAPIDGLNYFDSEGYSASFDTGEQFGCVHWLARAGQ